MIRLYLSRRGIFLMVLAIGASLALVLASRGVRAGQDAQQGQQPQSQTDQGQSQGQSQQQPKKKGGIFGGLKTITGAGTEQSSATKTAGTKGVGEGAQIGDVTPTPADRQAVTQMENNSVPPGDLSKFIKGGGLKPKQ